MADSPAIAVTVTTDGGAPGVNWSLLALIGILLVGGVAYVATRK